MNLSDLEPEFLYTVDGKTLSVRQPGEEPINGIRFLCPKCFKANNSSPIGVHSIICWFKGVPNEIYPNPGRWVFSYDKDFSTVTLGPSVHIKEGCGAHFHIIDGFVKL